MKPTPELSERLKQFTLFKPIAADQAGLDAVASILQPTAYPAGETIIHKGDIGDQAFLLVEGTVEICDYTMDGEPFVRAILQGSDSVIFGELALTRNDKRTATVIARTACTCWTIRRDDFIRLGDQNPYLGWQLLQQIAKVLAARLEKTNQDVLTLFEALILEIEHKAILPQKKPDQKGYPSS